MQYLKKMQSFNLQKNLIIIALVIVGSAGGFFLGRYSVFKVFPAKSNFEETKPKYISPIFQSQTATTQGEITNLEGNTLTIKGWNAQTESFSISQKLVVYQATDKPTSATGSSALKSIKVGKQAFVVLELINNQFQVTSISYIPE